MEKHSVGRFHLDGLPPAPRGVPQIEVSVDSDVNGVLNVSAKDKDTSKEQSIRIEAASGLSDEEIERMRQDAQVHEDEDKHKRDEVDLHNNADQLIHQTETQSEEFKDKLSDSDRAGLDEALEKLKTANSGSNRKDIQDAIDGVNRIWSDLATKMYAETKTGDQNQPEADTDEESAAKGEDGEIEDADFEVLNDKK